MSTNRLAEIGSLVGDPGRANMLIALMDGRALSASELAGCAGVTQQTASGHLAKLVTAGLIRVEQQGRHRYHRLASSEVARMLEAMQVAGAGPASGPRTGPRNPEMRMARSCYDHIAGRLGVALSDALMADPAARGSCLSEEGEAKLATWGIDLDAVRKSRRDYCRLCLDWSERRFHIAGAIGAAMLDQGLAAAWLRRRPENRSLMVTRAGELGFRRLFGVEVQP